MKMRKLWQVMTLSYSSLRVRVEDREYIAQDNEKINVDWSVAPFEHK